MIFFPLYFFFFNFLFYIVVQLINNVALVSGVQQSDSVIHTHISILFQVLFPFRLLQNIEQSSLCYTVGPCWLSILNLCIYVKFIVMKINSGEFKAGCIYSGLGMSKLGMSKLPDKKTQTLFL